MAARDGHLSVVEYLVNQRADINAKNKNGETPLGLASEIKNYYTEDQKKGKLDVVEFFRSKGGIELNQEENFEEFEEDIFEEED